MDEQWRTCIYNGEIFENYEVSNFGRVRNIKTDRILKPILEGGYYMIGLMNNGKAKRFKVHRLVAFTFPNLVPNDDVEHKTQINHIDENKLNNHVSNLEWVTPLQNSRHGTRTERSAKARSKQILCIETGVIYESISQASRETGIDVSNIGKCLTGKRKSCGGYRWEYVK